MGEPDARTLVDAVICARRWTTDECVRHFSQTATTMGEAATLSAAQLKRWRHGRLTGLPRPTACRVAERLFGYPIEELLAPAPTGHVPRSPVAASGPVHRPSATGLAQAPVPDSVLPQSLQRRQASTPTSSWPYPAVTTPHLLDGELDPIMSAAHDASEHAADAGRAIEDTTLEQLSAEVTRLAHVYATTPPALMFLDLKRARDLTYRMLERTSRPTQITGLYLVAGQLSGLMAAASYDLGNPDAANEQARAAFTYGQVIDHHTLRAWARATLSMIALWSGHPRDGATHARNGLEFTTTGDTAVRLHALAGRCWALAGATTEATDAMREADQAREHDNGVDEFADGIGGEFVFGPARHALCGGATHLALDNPTEAAHQARTALALYETGPPEQRAIGGIHGARVDLAVAHAQGTDLDGVLDAVGPTLDLNVEHRTTRLTARLQQLRAHLAAPRFHGSLQAEHLADGIEEFMTSAAAPRPRALG